MEKLKRNPELIISDFDGYKLASLPSNPLTYNILDGISMVSAPPNASFQSLKFHGFYNYVFSDGIHVYVVDAKGRLLCWNLKLESSCVADIYCLGKDVDVTDPVSVVFPISTSSSRLVVVSNGCGDIYVYNQCVDGNEENTWPPRPWTCLRRLSNINGVVRAAALNQDGCLHIAVESHRKIEADTEASNQKSDILLTSIVLGGDTFEISLSMCNISSGVHTEFVSVVPCVTDGEEGNNETNVFVVATEKFSSDANNDRNNIIPDCTAVAALPSTLTSPPFSWTQNNEEVVVMMTLDQKNRKQDNRITFTATSLRIEIAERLIVEGQLHSTIDTDCSTWTLSENCTLEVTLTKCNKNYKWTELIIGCNVDETKTETEIAEAREALAHLTSEFSEPLGGGPYTQVSFGERVEECDVPQEHMPNMFIYNTRNLHPVDSILISGDQRWLFGGVNSKGWPVCCIADGYDALLFRLGTKYKSPSIAHEATINVLAYVAASKMNLKFLTVAPSGRFAALAECRSHIFIYKQPTHDGEKIATQYIVPLADPTEVIMGISATEEGIFALTENAIIYISVP